MLPKPLFPTAPYRLSQESLLFLLWEADRRQRLQETAGLSLRTSATNSIDVAEYNGEQFEDED